MFIPLVFSNLTSENISSVSIIKYLSSLKCLLAYVVFPEPLWPVKLIILSSVIFLINGSLSINKFISIGLFISSKIYFILL